MKLFFKVGLIILVLNCTFSCNKQCNVKGILVSELLIVVSKEKSINYCDLLSSALNGNNEAIKELSLLEFNDSTGYDHGSVLVELILKIGEDKYLKGVEPLNVKQKKLVQSYLDVGLEYGNISHIKEKRLDKVFPTIDTYLTME